MTSAQAAPTITLRTGDALLLVDVQNDFLAGGSLPVPAGEVIVPFLNRYIRAFRASALPVYATRDWHPPGHCSFSLQGGAWPPHCVAGTPGAGFAHALELDETCVIIDKATQPDGDAYSGFQGTDLAAQLRKAGVNRLFIGGLATDYCVLNTVRDALGEGFAVLLLDDAIRAVNVQADDGKRAREEMVRLGARPVRIDDLARRPA